jgi:hypothetical protein
MTAQAAVLAPRRGGNFPFMQRAANRLLVGVVGLAASSIFGVAAAGAVSPRQLALMPLPLAAYGRGVAALPIAHDSGVLTNGQAALVTNQGVGASTFVRLGRLTGYTLDYGSKIPGGSGVTEAQTTVESYRSAAAAAAGLAFWRKDDADVASASASGLSVVFSRFSPLGLGRDSFGDLGSVGLKGEATVYGADVGFRNGDLVAQVSITAGSLALTRPLAQLAAIKLRARIQAVLSGRLAGSPVALPGRPTAGPPASGPDPRTLALTAAEVGGTVSHQGYQVDAGLDPISEYERSLLLPGSTGLIQDQVTRFRTPAQAHYEATILADFATSTRAWSAQGGLGNPIRSFRPRAVTIRGGDEAHAVLGLARLANGRSVYLAFILLRVGSTIEYITVATPASIKLEPSALVQLAGLALGRAEPRGATAPVA